LLSLGKIDEIVLLDNVTKILIGEKARVLIEFIKKKSAESFYKRIKEMFPNKRVFLLTGDDNKFTRNNVIAELNKKDENGNFVTKDVILVATQVIEAGVDIDMDIGFKDISILDGEEQFLGRINRSCNREGAVAYFFNMDKATEVYRNDFRLEKDLLQEEYQQYLENKDFNEFYELCFTRLYENKNEANANSINGLYSNLRALNFKEIQEKMKLIDNKNYELYIPYVYKDNDITIDGRNLWYRYRSLLNDKDMNYSERMIKLSQVISEMQLFLFNSIKKPGHYSESIGDIYYVENGEDYITEGYRFNREKYEKSYEGDMF
jgi:CRISPR-associated endonuclease/helicase Cas3